MVDKLISTIIILMLSLAILSPLMVSVAHAAEFEAGADPSFVQASTVMSLDKLASTFSSESESDYNYVSHVFTVADVIFFSYVDGTMLALYDSSETLIWNNGGNPLNKGGHAHVAVPQGVYTACGSEKFAVLTGDPITRYVLGYYAMDQNGYGVSTELYTWVPLLYGHCSFIIFGYEDNTQVTVDETDTGINIATFALNKGQHWQIETLESKWLHITANHPVSALTCYDQGYLVPSSNGRWSGTEFYTYVSDIQSWPEDLTVISYSDDTLVTIKDSNTGSLVWSGELDEGQAHVESFPSGANRFFTITSSKSVTVAVQPWVAMTSNYHQGLYIGDSTGTRLGTDLIGSTLNGGYLYILAYRDNTNVVVYNSRTGGFVKSYTLNDGDYVEANPGNGLWRIMSNYPVSAYSGWGQWNAEFAPVEFREVTPVMVDISAEKKCYATGEGINLRVKVTDANGNPLYPLKKDDFKIYIDESVAKEYDERVEDAIDWAMDWADGTPYPPGGEEEYRAVKYVGWCLAFVQDTYDIGADKAPPIETNDGDIKRYEYAKQAADALGAENNKGIPPRGAFVFYDWFGTIEGVYKNWGHVGLSLGDGQLVHAWTDGPAVASYDEIGLKYIGWAWPPTSPPIAFERVSAIDYRVKIKAPETVGTYSITVTVTVVTGKGTSTTEIKVYAIEGISLTVGGNRLTQYENSGDTPIYYRGDSNIYPIFYIDVEVNGATLQEIRNDIWVYVEIKDHTEVKDRVRTKAVYDSITSKFKAQWKNSPNDYPVGKYDVTAKVEDSTGISLASSGKKFFYLIFKPPVGYESFVSVTHSTEVRSSWNVWKYNLHQFEYRNWKPTLDIITGKISVGDAAQTLLLFAHGIDGSYYGYWHMDDDERLQVFDPTHPSGGDFIYESFGCLNNYGSSPWWWNQNAWWYDVDTFQDSNFNPEGYQLQADRLVGVCADYAPLLISNLASAGIPAREVTGYFADDSGHAVTEVYYDDQWHHYDPTWNMFDAPSIYSQVGDYWTQYLTRDNSPDSSQTVDRKDFYNYIAETTDIKFDKTDYNYPDWVTATLTVKNTGHVDILTAHLHLKIYDHPTVARLGVNHLISDTKINSDATGNISPILAVGQSFTVSCTYKLPDFGLLNGFYELLGDRYLVAVVDYYNDTTDKAHSIYTLSKAEKEVPGLCSEWCPQITVDSFPIELSPTVLTSFYFNETINESLEAFVEPQDAYVTVEHNTKYSAPYTREKWYIFNPDSNVHKYSLTIPLIGVGDAVYIPGYGPVTSNQTVSTSANYIVIYNTTIGTNGPVDIYTFSKNMTLKNVTIFNGVIEIVGMQNCTLASESGESYLIYLSTRSGYGWGFNDISNNFAQEIISNGDTLTQFSVEGEHEQIFYHKVGDIIYVNVSISNNGIVSETKDLSLTITEPGVWGTENIIYNATKTLIVSARGEATVTFQYQIPNNPQIGKHRIIVHNGIVMATTIFMIQTPFSVVFDIPITVTQAQGFYVNATITNALDRSLSGINITIKLPNDFSTPENLTNNIGALLSGESIDVSWYVVATDFEYGYEPIAIYIRSAEGINDIATTSLTVLRLPELKIFSSAPSEAQVKIPFKFSVNVTNQGDLSLQSVSVTLSLPDNVIASDILTKYIGDLAGGETKSVSWMITSMLEGDFWITVNASDITNTHSAQTTELINVVKPEIELNVFNPVEAILHQEFLLTAIVKNIGELAATDVKVSLTLPTKLITMDPININIAYLSPGQTEVIEWTMQGVTPGYAEITVNASTSSISVTKGVIITYFPLSVKTDKNTYLSDDNVIITTTTTNENPEVSYVDLSINVTIDGPSLQNSYSMPIDFISSLETRNFALTWDSTGKPFGIYVVTAKLLENTIVLNETTTSFTLTTVDNIPPTTLLTIGEPKYLDLMGNAYVSSATPFTLAAEDNLGGTGVASTFYRVYNSSYDTGWLEYSEQFYLVGLSDGEYSIDYYSTDNIGNTEPTNTATVIIDNTSPTTTLTIGEPKYVSGATYVVPDTLFTLEATDEESGVNSTFYKVYNSTLPGVWQKYSTPFNLTGYKNGNYTIAYYSIDNAGNTEPIKEANVTLCRSYDNPGDLTGDGKVDIYDITMICVAYDSKPGDPNWNPIADFCPQDWSHDIINIFDIVTCLQYYGP
jgi:cell wall-associated NlpC family hydrolase